MAAVRCCHETSPPVRAGAAIPAKESLLAEQVLAEAPPREATISKIRQGALNRLQTDPAFWLPQGPHKACVEYASVFLWFLKTIYSL